jgi:hypothetical protein
MSINKFFESIDSQQHINFKKYIDIFKKSGVDIEKMFIPVLKKNPYYYLIPKDEEQYQQLKSTFHIAGDKITRLDATLHGNSHHVNVSYCFFLMRETIDSPVESVFFKGEELLYSNIKNINKNLILIENLENFGDIKKTFQHFSIDLSQYSFIFGAGNAINNSLLTSFFNTRDSILCMFDVDNGGLKMFNTLSKRHANTEFIVPDNIDLLMYKHVRHKITVEDAIILTESYRNNTKMTPIISIINKHMKFIEQEIYLKEDSQ